VINHNLENGGRCPAGSVDEEIAVERLCRICPALRVTLFEDLGLPELSCFCGDFSERHAGPVAILKLRKVARFDGR
jgi:hypothetical protein